MADFDARPTFRVRDTGQLLVCKCKCHFCEDAAQPSDHCTQKCSIGRHMAKARQRAELKAKQAAERMRETGIIER